MASGSPVHELRFPDVGVPRTGATNVGALANTSAPVPVSSVNANAKFALVGVVKKVAIFAASPDTPVAIGNPVHVVNVPDVGVPNIGVVKVGFVKVGVVKVGLVKVGLVANTNNPVPVSSLIAVRKLALVGLFKKAWIAALNPAISFVMLYQLFVAR